MIVEAVVVLSLVAAALAGPRGATVTCSVAQQPEDWGFADLRGRIVHLRPNLCYALLHPGRYERQTALGVLVLAHEVAHLRGHSDERSAECWGLAHVSAVAAMLGWAADRTARITAYARQWDKKIAHPCKAVTG